MAKKKEVVQPSYCYHCEEDVFFATVALRDAHIEFVHASIYDKIVRGDYVSKLPYPPYNDKGDAAKAEREAYRTDTGRLVALFRHDLEVEDGTIDNPKKDKLWDLAWSHGHSSGFSEIANYYHEFAELVR